jgi:phosphate transport system permease protein
MQEPAVDLRATGRGRRRLLVNRLAEALAVGAAALAVGALVIVIWSVGSRAIGAINLDFFTQGPAQFGEAGGGIAPAIAGSLLLVAVATIIALPVGVLTAIYVSEFAPVRIGRMIRLWLDVLNGFPSIVIGIFVFTILVKTSVPILGVGHHQSAIAGGVALAIIMLPTVTRTTEEMLRLVPDALREGALALGVPRWKAILTVVLRTAAPGIATGVMLAVARVAGETAPLLFTAFGNDRVSTSLRQPIGTMSVQIFNYAKEPYDLLNQQAAAGALVLVAFVLFLNVAARVLVRRKK